MDAFSGWQVLPTVGFAITLALMVWVLIDLARLRRHPDFRSPLAGSLRLHLMVLGMSAQGVDDPARRRILAARRRVYAALAVFALSAGAVLIMTGGVPQAPA